MYFWLFSPYFHPFSALHLSKCLVRGVPSWCTPSLALALLCRLTATSPSAARREGGMQLCGWNCHPISLLIKTASYGIGRFALERNLWVDLWIFTVPYETPLLSQCCSMVAGYTHITCNCRWHDNRYRGSSYGFQKVARIRMNSSPRRRAAFGSGNSVTPWRIAPLVPVMAHIIRGYLSWSQDLRGQPDGKFARRSSFSEWFDCFTLSTNILA